MTKYLTFKELGSEKGKRSNRWEVYGLDNTRLGYIIFHAPWRRYVYRQCTTSAIFDAKCLTELAERLDFVTELHKMNHNWEDTIGALS